MTDVAFQLVVWGYSVSSPKNRGIDAGTAYREALLCCLVERPDEPPDGWWDWQAADWMQYEMVLPDGEHTAVPLRCALAGYR